MARWKVRPASGGSLSGGIEYDNHGAQWKIQQDINPFLEEAKMDRDLGEGNKHIRKLYSIPEVVAIEIKEKWGIDVFSVGFMYDKEEKARVHAIIQQHYPKLLSTNVSF